METKDLLVQAGVLVTLVLGLVNLYFNLRVAKRTSFINTVTSERVKWISSVRANVATLCALCDQWIWHKTQENMPNLQHQIEELKAAVRLQLNPKDEEDQEIERLLSRLPTWTQSMSHEEYSKLQLILISATQRMLKREWDKVIGRAHV